MAENDVTIIRVDGRGIKVKVTVTAESGSAVGFDEVAAPTTVPVPALSDLVLGQYITYIIPDDAVSNQTEIYKADFDNTLVGKTALSFPNLVTCVREFIVNACPDLTSISLPLLETCLQLWIENNTFLTTFFAPSLTEIGGIQMKFKGNNGVTELLLPALTTIGNGAEINGGSLETIDLAALTNCASNLRFNNLGVLTALDLSTLATVGGYLYVQNTEVFEELELPLLSSSGGLVITSNTGLTTINAPLISTTSHIEITDNPALTTITLDDELTATALDFTNNALNSATVNAVLAALVAAGNSSGTVDFSGGTNESETGQGVLDKAALEGLGWTVTTNGV